MTLNELITKLETLRDDAPGNGELPVYASDWGEDYRPPTPVDDPVIKRKPFTTEHLKDGQHFRVYVKEAVFVI